MIIFTSFSIHFLLVFTKDLFGKSMWTSKKDIQTNHQSSTLYTKFFTQILALSKNFILNKVNVFLLMTNELYFHHFSSGFMCVDQLEIENWNSDFGNIYGYR